MKQEQIPCTCKLSSLANITLEIYALQTISVFGPVSTAFIWRDL